MGNGSGVRQVLCAVCCVIAVLGNAIPAGAYQGREPGAKWRGEALARIEKIRKSDFSVEVVDRKGAPLQGAEVTVSLQQQAFGFGTAVTSLDLTAQTPDAERLRQLVERNFNRAVFENDLKWMPWETAQLHPNTVYRMDNIDRAFLWQQERGIQVRGHYVVYGHLEGDGGTTRGTNLPAEEYREWVLKHAEEKVKAVGSRVTEWDVVNHPLGWGKGTMAELFGPLFYDQVFDLVAQWNPKAQRYINEGSVLPRNGRNRESYFELISQMRARGAKIQGIGFMGHFHEGDFAPPQELLATFDRYARFGLPLQITELDVRFAKGSQLSREQEALQADYFRDLLIAAFSHPAFEGVMLWGFWEGRHWHPEAALYRKDWSIKPNGRVWEDLVLQKWRTEESGKSDARGIFRVRAFHGDYRVKATYRGKTKVLQGVPLERGGRTLRVTLD